MPEYYGNNDWRDYKVIQHWKYLRREKVNGKWKYYYENKKDDKLTRNTTSKGYVKTSSSIIPGPGANGVYGEHTKYFVEDTVSGEREVDKETYDKTKSGTNLVIGKTPVKEIAKEQLSMAISFVKDLFGGNLATKEDYMKVHNSRLIPRPKRK